MADPTTVGHYQTWIARGVSRTRWDSITINTTGDVGSAQGSANLIGGIEVMVTATGSLSSVGVLAFEESMDATTWTTANTICGTPMTFDSATAVGLSTGVAYHVRPGALYYRPHFTAGASGTDIASVIMIQRA
jgi:hypothetical protein